MLCAWQSPEMCVCNGSSAKILKFNNYSSLKEGLEFSGSRAGSEGQSQVGSSEVFAVREAQGSAELRQRSARVRGAAAPARVTLRYLRRTGGGAPGRPLPLPRQGAAGGSLLARRSHQICVQRPTDRLSACHRLSGGCTAPSPDRPQPGTAPSSPQPLRFPQLPQPDFSHRGNQSPIAALRQEKHRHKHKAAFGKTAIACSGSALKRERAELKMCQEQPGWHCFIFTKKSLLIAH
ncbi:uncharacterized protein [Taeniopygia guttata]|uniref:uncharacterized protein n=1 Tax=Taeniopygia guttata TaxID=59729 RepID=UPI003BB8A2ED